MSRTVNPYRQNVDELQGKREEGMGFLAVRKIFLNR
jgi:hypothetical protein